jgi:hypothetical protein
MPYEAEKKFFSSGLAGYEHSVTSIVGKNGAMFKTGSEELLQTGARAWNRMTR